VTSLDGAAREAELLRLLGRIAGNDAREADVRKEGGDLESILAAARDRAYAKVEFLVDGDENAYARISGSATGFPREAEREATYALPRETERFVLRHHGSSASAEHARATFAAAQAPANAWATAAAELREAVKAGGEGVKESLTHLAAAMFDVANVFIEASKERNMWDGWIGLGQRAQEAGRAFAEPDLARRLGDLATADGTARAVEREIAKELSAGEKVLSEAAEAYLKAWTATWDLNFHEDGEVAKRVVGELQAEWTAGSRKVEGPVAVKDMPDEFKQPFALMSGTARPRVVVESGKRGIESVVEQQAYTLREGYSSELPPTSLADEGREVSRGTRLAWPLEAAGEVARDITSGLPRIAELFEARKPKDPAILAEAAGTVSIQDSRDGKKGKRKIVVRGIDAEGRPEERAYLVPKGKNIQVNDGDQVEQGDILVPGAVNPHDWLKCFGEAQLARYLVEEIQLVYRLQSVKINDKHIEVVVRQMLRRVRVTHAGKSSFLVDEAVEKHHVFAENERIRLAGGKDEDLVKFEPLLLGITKASLSTDSFLSAASFQETTRVLTEAAIYGRRDTLRGLKENILMGRLIPAGTGFAAYAQLGMLEQDTSDAGALEGLDQAAGE